MFSISSWLRSKEQHKLFPPVRDAVLPTRCTMFYRKAAQFHLRVRGAVEFPIVYPTQRRYSATAYTSLSSTTAAAANSRAQKALSMSPAEQAAQIRKAIQCSKILHKSEQMTLQSTDRRIEFEPRAGNSRSATPLMTTG